MHRLNSVYRSVALLVLLCGASSPRAELITIDTTISAKVTSLTALGRSTVGTINSGILAGSHGLQRYLHGRGRRLRRHVGRHHSRWDTDSG